MRSKGSAQASAATNQGAVELSCHGPRHQQAADAGADSSDAAVGERDRKRQEDLLLAGIAMTRVTGPRLEREPHQVIARVAQLLGAPAI